MLAGLMPALPGSAAPAASLCQAGEQVYFACTVGKGPRQLALCGRLSGSPEASGYLQYRFGTPAHLDLVYPARREGSLERFSWRRDYMKTRRMESYELAFRNGRYGYTVYLSSYPLGDEESDGYAEDAGVRVSDGGKQLADLRCGGAVTQYLSGLGVLQ
jgi:hypothetical protein